jgi:hypothetical protein
MRIRVRIRILNSTVVKIKSLHVKRYKITGTLYRLFSKKKYEYSDAKIENANEPFKKLNLC